MNTVSLLQADYWFSIADRIWIWLQREIITEQSLINLLAVIVGMLLAWLIARPLKPKLSAVLTAQHLSDSTLGRFLQVLLSRAFTIALVLLAAFFHVWDGWVSGSSLCWLRSPSFCCCMSFSSAALNPTSARALTWATTYPMVA